MKRILAFAGSNNSKSINHQLVKFTASLITDHEVTVLDIRNWDIPVYSIDMDPDQTPDKITELISLIKEHDGCIMSSPEHNGAPSAFLKNILDWLSRRQKKYFDNKKILLMSTSPGAKGGANHLKRLKDIFPYHGAEIVSSYSLPSFFDNYQEGRVIGEQLEELKRILDLFLNEL